MKKPEVGDRVLVEIAKIGNTPGLFTFVGSNLLVRPEIFDVIPKPWTPEVGGRVKLLGGNFTHEILAIDGNSAFLKCVAVNYHSASHSIGDHRCTPLESLVCAD